MTTFQPPDIPATDAAKKLAEARHLPLGAIPRERDQRITQPMVRAYLKAHKDDLPSAQAVGAEIAAAASGGAAPPAPTPAAPPAQGEAGTVSPEALARVRGAMGAEPPVPGAPPDTSGPGPAQKKAEPWRAEGLGTARDVAVDDTVLIDGRAPGVVAGFTPTAGGERVLVVSEAHPVGADDKHLTIAYPPGRLVKVRP